MACSSACGRSSIPPSTWQSLWCRRAAGRERLAREPCAGERRRPGAGSRGRSLRGADARREQPQALDAQRSSVSGVAPGRPERLDAVRHRVHPARGRDGGGQVVGQLGVVDDEPGRDAGVAARRLAAVLGDAPDGRQLGAGVGRGHRGDRQPARVSATAFARPTAEPPPIATRQSAASSSAVARASAAIAAGTCTRTPTMLLAGAERSHEPLGVRRVRAPCDHERPPRAQALELLGQRSRCSRRRRRSGARSSRGRSSCGAA